MSEHNFPYKIEKGEHYIPSLYALTCIYTQHPKFNGNVKLIYDILFDMYNREYGYAFPTFNQLAQYSGLSVKSCKNHVKVLRELDLVEVTPSKKNNNTYVVKKPVQTFEQFYARFPEIEAQAKERIERLKQDDKAEKERKEAAQAKPVEKRQAELVESWF